MPRRIRAAKALTLDGFAGDRLSNRTHRYYWYTNVFAPADFAFADLAYPTHWGADRRLTSSIWQPGPRLAVSGRNLGAGQKEQRP